MGLFSFVGKALKAVSKVAGFIPGIGSTISKVTGTVGNLLDHKSPLATTGIKLATAYKYGTPILRGNTTQSAYTGGLQSAQELRSSPVLPGGAVATPSGPVAKSSSPAKHYSRTGTKKRKKATTKRRAGGKKTKTKKRKLKFGSAAYRKKYLGHR